MDKKADASAWKKVGDMKSPRSGFYATVVGNTLYALGGFCGVGPSATLPSIVAE